ncbi:ERI1 exoribonuclease 3 [Cichlidogyrus casuarinus]|uniref:ERI1 exoribonuclease 3 n=1 Tax=Cichlidogyrus casuarinus TaxID=1844966 RepID=A0ABD2PIH3_9PLAT
MLVLDFEATCKENCNDEHEIIEFPVLAVDCQSLDIIAEFHRYVRPIHYPVLTDFCTDLTGITQQMVESQDTFPAVLQQFHTWLKELGLVEAPNCPSWIFLTCGDWDLRTMLPLQCQMYGLEIPQYFSQWYNVKRLFRTVYGYSRGGMMTMLNRAGIQHIGRHHSGIGQLN